MSTNNIYDVIIETPLEYNETLSNKYKCEVYLKREDMQFLKTAKIRGVLNKFLNTNKENLCNGVVSCSTGNMGYCVAYCCYLFKINGIIFVPTNVTSIIKNKMSDLGKEFVTIKEESQSFSECLNKAMLYTFDTHKVFIHPYDDQFIISGYETIANEIQKQLCPDFPDFIVCPVVGGALISGIINFVDGKCKIIGVEENDCACMSSAIKSLKPIPINNTLTKPNIVGHLTYDKCINKLFKIVTVTNECICDSVELLHDIGIVSETMGAMTIASLDDLRYYIKGKKIVCIISGGNIDISEYSSIKIKSAINKGLLHYFVVSFPQKPGSLKTFVNDVLNYNDDIIRFEYLKKSNSVFGNVLVGIKLDNPLNLQKVKNNMKKFEFSYKRIKPDDELFSFFV